MHYGLALPFLDAHTLVELTQEAEAAGWDGVFCWEGDGIDVWIALTAAAMRTKRVRLGTMVTPLPRRQPWKVASEAATLDFLSNGRVILPVGLGVVDFEKLGITKDYKVRAKMLDEGLEIINNWWGGQPFSYDGTYYHIEETTGTTPVQTPRIPIWVIGGEKQSQIRRAARWDGVIVGGSPAEVQERVNAIMVQRVSVTPLDIITEGETPGDNPQEAAAIVCSYADAGITWWIESVWNTPQERGGVEGMRTRIKQGPPLKKGM